MPETKSRAATPAAPPKRAVLKPLSRSVSDAPIACDGSSNGSLGNPPLFPVLAPPIQSSQTSTDSQSCKGRLVHALEVQLVVVSGRQIVSQAPVLRSPVLRSPMEVAQRSMRLCSRTVGIGRKSSRTWGRRRSGTRKRGKESARGRPSQLMDSSVQKERIAGLLAGPNMRQQGPSNSQGTPS